MSKRYGALAAACLVVYLANSGPQGGTALGGLMLLGALCLPIIGLFLTAGDVRRGFRRH